MIDVAPRLGGRLGALSDADADPVGPIGAVFDAVEILDSKDAIVPLSSAMIFLPSGVLAEEQATQSPSWRLQRANEASSATALSVLPGV